MSFDSALVPPVRRMRTDALVAHIMQIVGKHLRGDGQRGCALELYDSFYEAGVEVITDETRRQAGLPPRNADGWTVEELHAMEAKRLEMLTRPISFVVPEGGFDGVDLTSPGFIVNKDPK